MAAHPEALVVSDEPWVAEDRAPERWRSIGDFLGSLLSAPASTGGEPPTSGGSDDVAVVLYTSGTSGTPKAALLRHRNLASYVFTTVEFAQAAEDEAALVTVPTYHIAGLANLLSNLYAGRRIVYLENFDPELWLETIRTESITQAMVVPTMMARVVRFLDGADAGGAQPSHPRLWRPRMPIPVLEEALARFPDTGFVNAYGLTETSSTIALLRPDDHRAGLHRTSRWPGPGWARSAGSSPGWRWRSGTRTAHRCPAKCPASSSCAGSRSRGSTRGVGTRCRGLVPDR